MRSGTAVRPDHVRRQLALGTDRLRVGRRVDERMDVASELPIEQNRARNRQVGRVGHLLGLPAQHSRLPGHRVDPDDGPRGRWPAGHTHDRVAVSGQARDELLESDVGIGHLRGLGVEQPEAHPADAVQDREPAVAQHRKRPSAELP